jgi:hypothetical protein
MKKLIWVYELKKELFKKLKPIFNYANRKPYR